MKPRDAIAVTGMGVWAAGARSPAELYETAVLGRSRAEWVHPRGARPVAGCRASDPVLPDHARAIRRLDRSAQMAFLAASQAFTNAELHDVDPSRVGVIVGSGRGPFGKALEVAAELDDKGRPGASASADSTPGSLAGALAQQLSLWGPSAVIFATCASAANAIGTGALHLLADDADVMIVGGADAPIVPLMLAQLSAAGVVGTGAEPALICRPFDARRNGMVIGEGAAFIVLEREQHAEARGAPIYARLAGWAGGVDAGGRSGATEGGDGLVRVVGRALAVAGLPASSVGYINAHGTGTLLNDRVETAAFARVFGASRVPPTSSTKPITGHCLGATPALEAVIAIESLRNQCLPPTANCERRDPALAIDVIAGEARPANVHTVLSTSMGFWGFQAALVFQSV